MRPAAALGKRLWRVLLENAKKAMQEMKPAVLRLPALIAFILLAFGAGWVGMMWAARPSPQQGISPNSRQLPPGNEGGSSGGKGYLGVRGRGLHQGAVLGVKIVEIFPDSPAAKAGLRSDRDPAPDYVRNAGGPTGHIIVGANGQPIRSEEDLGRLLTLSSPGSMVKFLVTSADGNSYEVIPVTLEGAPETFPPIEASAEQKVRMSSPQGNEPARRMEEEIFRAVNRARGKKGLPPLKENPQLQSVARHHSQDMATRHFFGHLNPDGSDLMDRLRVERIEDFTAVGENILTGKEVADLAQVAVREWLKSPGHRKNLLNPRYTEGGVGIAGGEKKEIYITQVYLER